MIHYLCATAVNVASRMESNSEPGRIHCSKASADILTHQLPEMRLKSRGEINIKGKVRPLNWLHLPGTSRLLCTDSPTHSLISFLKGNMHTFWVNHSGKFQSTRSLVPEQPASSKIQSQEFSMHDIAEETSVAFSAVDIDDSEAEEPERSARFDGDLDLQGFVAGSFVDV